MSLTIQILIDVNFNIFILYVLFIFNTLETMP